MSQVATATLPAASDLISLVSRVSGDLEALQAAATSAVRARVSENGKVSAARIDAEQHAAHGLSWLATYVTGVREAAGWAQRLADDGKFGEVEQLLLANDTLDGAVRAVSGVHGLERRGPEQPPGQRCRPQPSGRAGQAPCCRA